MYKKLNLENWARKSTFDFFKNFEDPFFNLTANVDVTKLFSHCKKARESFFLSTLYASTKVCNDLENFRMRISEDDVIIYHKIQCGSSVFHKENNTFSYCYFEYYENRNLFLTEGQRTLDEHLNNPYFDARHDEDNLIYHSVIPWVHFTQFKHAKKKMEGDSIPRVTFGKVLETSSGKFEMPVSLEVNHALCDGFHSGMWFESFQREVNNF